jgi:hypothetical protein
MAFVMTLDSLLMKELEIVCPGTGWRGLGIEQRKSRERVGIHRSAYFLNCCLGRRMGGSYCL